VRTFTKPALAKELDRARASRWDTACTDAEKAAKLPAALLLAIASQETDMNDVVGDGGHGRGLFQIDDRSHRDFLARNGAGGPGGRPPVPAAARYAADLVRSNYDFGVRNGVREADRLRFALSAYNAGAGGALAGHREGDSDRRTTGGDYGRSVLARWAVYQDLLGVAPPPLLRRGSRGKRVEELKARLEGWYAKHAPGDWEAFRITPGRSYGVRVEAAVRDFQRRVGLGVDGVAGPDTQRALERGRKPRAR
jgi:hypothetical protein